MGLSGPLLAQPDEVGRAILAAVEKGRDVIHVRRIWWLVMAIIKTIPEGIFKKTSI